MNYALVTGATSGIGLAIAESLLRQGNFVFLNYANNKERADKVKDSLAEYAGNFDFVKADLTEYDGVKAVYDTLKRHGVELKYLVLNFGITDRTTFGEIDVAGWERVIRTNVGVPFFMIQTLFNAGILAQNASVLCVGSLMASIPHTVSVSYGVSKAALSSLCSQLVKFLAPSSIRINAVEPGFIDTPWQRAKPSEQRSRIEAKTALRRFGTPQEVADLSAAILNNAYMTGTIVPISGGYAAE